MKPWAEPCVKPQTREVSVCVCVCVWKSLSHVWLFATPWTEACQISLSMEFSRQEYWSGLPFPSPGDLPNPGLPYCCWVLYRLSHQGSPDRWEVSPIYRYEQVLRQTGDSSLSSLSFVLIYTNILTHIYR